MYVYIYIYICLRMGGWSCTLYDGLSWLCEWPSLFVSDLLWPWVLLTLWHEYMLKAIAVGAYSCYIECIVTTVWSSWSMSPSDISFPMYASRINVFKRFEQLRPVLAQACWHTPYTQAQNPTGVSQCTKRETLPDFCRENGASPLLYSQVKILVRIECCVLWHI